MQWLSLLLWSALVWYGARSPRRRLLCRLLLTVGLALSMAGQLWLLALDGLLSVATGLPLHLCGLMGVLSIPLLWLSPPWLYHFSLLLGAPAAFAALCFPSVIQCSHPLLMQAYFGRLHVLILCCALFGLAQKQPLPNSPRASFLLGNGYLLFTAVFNRLFHTNYLFLRAAPAGTPLALFFRGGNLFYLCALELSAMLCMTLVLAGLKRLTAKTRSAYSPYSRCTLPCTIPRREPESSRSAP